MQPAAVERRISSASAGGNCERRQLAARDPSHLLTELRPRLAEQLAREEMQLDAAIRVGVRRREQLVADARVDVELFAQLARQAAGRASRRIAFAAGKLPEALEMDAALARVTRNAAVALDDRRGDDDRRHVPGRTESAAALAIGQTRHLGFRATQTVAPKSISA